MMRSFLARVFGRSRGKPPLYEPRHGTAPAGMVYAGPQREPSPPPPPPPPPPVAAVPPGAPRVRLVLADGRVADVSQDPELADRIGYLARNLVDRDSD